MKTLKKFIARSIVVGVGLSMLCIVFKLLLDGFSKMQLADLTQAIIVIAVIVGIAWIFVEIFSWALENWS